MKFSETESEFVGREIREMVEKGMRGWQRVLELFESEPWAVIREFNFTGGFDWRYFQAMHRLRRRYAREIRAAVKMGTASDRVISQSDEYSKMVESMRRYKKAVHTSFANVSDAVDRSDRRSRGYKSKRQDGKKMTDNIRDDIRAVVDDFESVFGRMSALFRKTDITIAHTNGKHPLLSTAGGCYHHNERTVTVGINKCKAGAHELAHWLDSESQAARGQDDSLKPTLFFDSRWRRHERRPRPQLGIMLSEQDVLTGGGSDKLTHLGWKKVHRSVDAYKAWRKKEKGELDDETKIIRARLGAYWSRPCEVFARLVEQYVATELGRESAAADDAAGETDQDRGQGGDQLAVCDLPNGRGSGATRVVRGDPRPHPAIRCAAAVGAAWLTHVPDEKLEIRVGPGLALRGHWPGSASPRRQWQDWQVGAGKRAWFAATEVVLR